MTLPEPLAAVGSHPLQSAIVAIFAVVYLGMFLGGLPKLRLDRTGVALLGAIALIGIGAVSTEAAARSVHLPTVLLLFAFMVVSAQMRLGGFYTAVTRRVAALPLSERGLLGALIAVAGGLSAVFSNDIICLAMTPVVAHICIEKRLDPVPFLVGLACTANIGSAATLIGNPQNMLIGSVLNLSFSGYLSRALPPVALSLLTLWLWLVFVPRQRRAPPAAAVNADNEPKFDAWQTTKGLLVAGSLLVIFLFTDLPRDVAALVGAGILLLSRRFHSSEVMGFIDWELLVLFIGLFVVNHAFQQTGLASLAVAWLGEHGIRLGDSGPLFLVGVTLSNLVSNVPATMLLLPHLSGERAGDTLALVSTLAGNLLLVGSITNLIVSDLARKEGIIIDWRQHVVIGLPITLITLLIVWFWLV
ncbi:anion transporter [Dechloromonas sp.]|uniref:anion transporter n=1 Tax=Dechloromonas sp. TaxID=1917218 RepID=UPI0011F6D338|nr:anion transporter [Dechloromonas sp.]MBU3696067.1 anion transporter [Dechloromonas sp.]TEX47525.1 MAG: anion transporter [Rhodocyclaceae bacterium]